MSRKTLNLALVALILAVALVGVAGAANATEDHSPVLWSSCPSVVYETDDPAWQKAQDSMTSEQAWNMAKAFFIMRDGSELAARPEPNAWPCYYVFFGPYEGPNLGRVVMYGRVWVQPVEVGQ